MPAYIRRTVSAPVAGLLLLAAALAAPRAEDYSAWGKSQVLYLNTTPDGANVTSTVRNFPVLVRLSAANFAFAQARGKGQDIRFAAASGAHLKYQIDRWDSAKAVAEVWVKVDSVKGNAADSLVMRWGKADAADSSDGNAVFAASNGYVGVWHMGGTGTADRKNSVAGGMDATTNYFDGDEGTEGAIGRADSLDAVSPYGDNLQLGDGYDDFTGGFTFTIWCKPSAASENSRLLDLGNGPGSDEVVLARDGTSDGIVFDNYYNTNRGKTIKVDNCFPAGQWQQFAVTVTGGAMNLYRNGALIKSDNLGNTITTVRRAFIYLGRNDWNYGSYFKGILDEAVIAKTSRSADWIKLGYANQGPDQRLVSFSKPPAQCQASFSSPKDTTLGEGSALQLTGGGACATGYEWSPVSGLTPRLLDPNDKNLQLFLPRIAQDTSFVLRFTASYADSAHYQDVRIGIRADIPDPIFTLPDTMAWNGSDSLMIKPTIANLAAIQASRQPDLNWVWTMAESEADTAWRVGGLMLKGATAGGDFTVKLCLDNNGPQICHVALVRLKIPVGMAVRTLRRAADATSAWDAAGRRRSKSVFAIHITNVFLGSAQPSPKNP